MSFLTNTRSLVLRGLVVAIVLVSAAACSADEATLTTTTETAGNNTAAIATTTEDATTSSTSERTTDTASTGETASAANDDNWTGPAWLTFPDEFVTAGVGTGQPPMLSVYFLTDRNAELQGFTRTVDMMNVDLGDGAPFDVPGRCSEGGQGFSSNDGATTVSISGEYNDYSIFLTITTPEGVAWSSLGGSPSAIADTGFFMASTVLNDNGEMAEAYLTVECVVGG